MKTARRQAAAPKPRHPTLFETLEPRRLLSMTWAHPAVLHSADDLQQMKARLNVEPWRSGYAAFAATPQASLAYDMQGPFTSVGNETDHLNEYDDDMRAVYYQAIQYAMTGNAAYAQKAVQIVDAWTTTQTTWSTISSGMAAGYNGKFLADGAEILRYSYPGWTSTETTNVVNYFNDIVWPVLGGTSTGLPGLRDANQGAMELDGAIALSIFSEDETKFRQSVDAFINSPVAGIAAGSLPTGQFSDFGRDQTHGGGMLGDLGLAAEMAWNQGVDLYGVLDNRLLKMAEYYTKYNLGYDVPYTQFGAAYGVYTEPGTYQRGVNSSYDLLVSAYTTRKGLPAPYTVQYNTAAGVSESTFLYDKNWTSTPAVSSPLPAPTSPDAPLPAPLPTTSLTNADVGAVGIAGSGTYSNGTWTLTGAGSQIWGTTDSFHFAYQTMTGDGTIIARVTGNTGAFARANAGVMMRATLAGDSAMIQASIDPPTNPGVNGSETFYRATAGAKPGEQFHPNVGVPSWVKIERRGNHFISYDSPDGVTWTPLRHMYSDMPATLYVGLVACSHDTTQSMTATFTNVSMGSGVSAPPPTPTGLNARPGNAKVMLNWVSSYGATAYNLRRSTTSGGPYTTIATGLTATTYADTTAANGTTYYYTVAATKSGQQSGDSAAAGVTPAAPLAKPTGLTATGVSATRIDLAWTATAGAWFYNVARATVSGGPYTTIANGLSSTTFTDTLAPNPTATPYYYVVSAVNAAGQGAVSTQATASTSATPISTSVAQPSVGTYDIAQLDFSGGTNNANNYTDKGVGQSFLTLGNAGGYDLGAIAFKGGGKTSSETDGTLTVRINSLSGSTLTTIATVTGTWSHLTDDPTWVTVSFAATPVHLNPNARYAFDVKRTGASGYFGLATGTGDAYAGGSGAYMGTASSGNALTTTTFTARGYDQTFIVKLGATGVAQTPPPAVQSIAVNDGAAQRSMVNAVTVDFTAPVTLAGNAIALTRRSTTGSAATSVPFALAPASGSSSRYVLTFAGTGVVGGSLSDGIYDLVVSGVRVTNAAGTPMSADQTLTFHRFLGDADGDRDVDATDSRAFRAALDSTSTAANYKWWLDFDGDGDVDATDSRAFRSRLDKTI